MNTMKSDISLSEQIPVTEPERQYYYIEKAKEYVKNLEAQIGHQPTFCVVTFGCQMNARDSEKLVGILRKIGYAEEEKEENADFVIYNTCTVRENANHESLWASGTVKPCQEKTSTYDDRSLRLYDAGTGSCREVKKELSVCGSDFWNP